MTISAKTLSNAVQRVPVWTVYVVGLVPAVAYFSLGLADRLGADPLKVLEKALGLWALRFLILTLMITPLRQVLGITLLRYRRALGLLSFYYAALHVLTYAVLDQGLDWTAIWADVLKRPYITVGMASFVLLIPLAVTSNNASIRRLGGHTWARVHKLVYVATAGAALHFVLLVKSWPLEPLIYAAGVFALLGYRLARTLRTKPRVRLARA